MRPSHQRCGSSALASTASVLASTALALLLPFAAAQSSPDFPVRDAPRLPGNAMQSNGISLGFLTQWGSQYEPTDVIRALGKSPAVWGDYWNVWPDEYDFRQADWHLGEMRRVADGDVKAVYAPAVLFHGRMNQWTQEMTDALAEKVRDVNEQGVPIWLRFCYEMNGGWMDYGLQPEDYVSTWRSVTNAIRAVTNETYMLWAPNVWNGDSNDIQAYQPYWPGEEYVDLVGLSLYSFGPYRSLNALPEDDLFRDSFRPFYNLVSPTSSSRNPLGLSRAYSVVIAETSAPYYYEIPVNSPYYTQAGDTDISPPMPNLNRTRPSLADPPYPRSDDELAVKATWLVQMVGNETAAAFPNLKAVSLFNYLKKGNGTAEVLADFRYVGSRDRFNATIEEWLRTNYGNNTAYLEGYSGDASAIRTSLLGLGGIVAVAIVVLAL
ncbi:hypothetical protein Rhopal_007489-T1 [Rhodotorula paludigena]|uniref:GH26 domain-containing protein n=1 Tax=Rhodotorula paludigena TaxID=86838 RepID=A0AAV5GWS4_9BASI|nr:hypothetical protein Rhopal_007489-T1 [Rhodotorula paludigena]